MSHNKGYFKYPYLEDLVEEIGKIADVDISGKDRSAKVAAARQIYCHIAHRTSVFTYEDIGNHINRDRSSVFAAPKTARNRLLYDKGFKLLFEQISLELSKKDKLKTLMTTMEGIVKINTHTAEALQTLSVEAWMHDERLAGETEPEIHSHLEQMKKERVLTIGFYTYLYMPETYLKKSHTQP